MKRVLKYFSLFEWSLYLLSVIAIIVSFFVLQNKEYLYLVASLIGVTSLIFCSKGHPLGQFLIIVFAAVYAIISYKFKYYGEMITYIGMTGLIAVFSLITWISNPSKESKYIVKVNELKIKEYLLMFLGTIIVTTSFYFILKLLNTSNLIISTISVLTSLIASYLTLRRSRFYGLAYAINDLVLIIMWSLATKDNFQYLTMVICFSAFLINDLYGFYNWTKTLRKQSKED